MDNVPGVWIDQSTMPPTCLPEGVDRGDLLETTVVGAAWRTWIDPRSGQVYDGQQIYDRWLTAVFGEQRCGGG